jgi:hypothetical protein
MAIRIELSLRLQNSPGVLARVCRTLADERVNIVALALESSGVLRLVVDNHVHAAGVLRDQHHEVTERDVLYSVIPNDPGAVLQVARLLADGQVNIDYAYGSGVEGGPMAALVVGVEDAQRASAASGI